MKYKSSSAGKVELRRRADNNPQPEKGWPRLTIVFYIAALISLAAFLYWKYA